MISGLFKKDVTYKLFAYKLCVWGSMYELDLALNNQQGLTCHKTQPNQG